VLFDFCYLFIIIIIIIIFLAIYKRVLFEREIEGESQRQIQGKKELRFVVSVHSERRRFFFVV